MFMSDSFLLCRPLGSQEERLHCRQLTLEMYEADGWALRAPVERMWQGVLRLSTLVEGCDPNSAALFQLIYLKADSREFEAIAREKHRTDAPRESITNHDRRGANNPIGLADVLPRQGDAGAAAAAATAAAGEHEELIDEGRTKFEELFQVIGLLANDPDPRAQGVRVQLREHLFPNLDDKAPGFSRACERLWDGERSMDALCRGADALARPMIERVLHHALTGTGDLMTHPWVTSGALQQQGYPSGGGRGGGGGGGGGGGAGGAGGAAHAHGSPSRAHEDEQALSHLMTFTGCTLTQARTCLEAAGGDVEAAANMLV